MRRNAHETNIRELRAKKLAGQISTSDKDSLIEMVLADKQIPATTDIDAEITTELLNWEATEAAYRSLAPKLAAAKHEAANKILAGLKPVHDKLMARLVSALVEASSANAELFALSRELIDKEVGLRNGVCDLMPSEVLGVPHQYSELAGFFRECVKQGYLKALPKELQS